MDQRDMPSTSQSPALRQSLTVTRRLGSEKTTRIPPKRKRYYIRLESESSTDSEDERSESMCSFQGYETELVMDTPDTDTKSEHEDSDEDFEIEYEVQSSSGNENVPVGNDSSSGADDFLAVAGAITAIACEPTLEASLTDGEDSDNSSTAEIEVRRTDYDVCMQCKLRNDNPLFTYCKKCFQLRKTFFPPRPRGFKKKDRKSKDDVILKQANSNLPDLIEEGDVNTITSSTSSLKSDIGKKSILEGKEKLNGEVVQSTLIEYKEVCIMCNADSKNSIFLHGSTAHMCCCYKCAMKSWKLNKKCPACNRRANNVIKVFVV